MKVEIITPVGIVAETTGESVVLPTSQGFVGILEGHAAMLSELGEGEVKIESAGKTSSYQVSGGFFQVEKNSLAILAESATPVT